MSAPLPYCTLFSGILTQESAMVVAGDAGRSPVDHSIARDGQGRPTLKGRTLAGALIASARKIYADLPACITSASERDAHRPSAWRLFTSHPSNGGSLHPDLRAHVAIRQDTGTQAQGKLFDTELLPRGLVWPFLLEVRADLAGADYPLAIGVAHEALNEWLLGRLWLGMGVARGPGWLRLSKLVRYDLDSRHVLQWPDSLVRRESLADRINAIADRFAEIGAPIEQQESTTYRVGPWRLQQAGLPKPLPATTTVATPARQPWWYAELEASLHCGQPSTDTDAYGWDGLAVGAHGAGARDVAHLYDHLMRPVGQAASTFQQSFQPYHLPVLARTANHDRPEPVIPGSAIRGPLRHALSRDLRSSGYRVLDPVTGQRYTEPATGRAIDPVATLFGTLEGQQSNTSSLLIRDAHLDGDWTAAWLHHHAEDEFTQGTYGRAKFDSVVLMSASFKTRLVVEAPVRAEVDMHLAFLGRLLPMMKAGHLPIGGRQWAGLGWVRWVFDAQQASEPCAEEALPAAMSPCEERP